MEALRSFGTNTLRDEDIMAKLQTIRYIVGLDEVMSNIDHITQGALEWNTLPAFVEEIKQSALLHACAWMSSGGIKRFRGFSGYENINQLAKDIEGMAGAIAHQGDVWNTGSKHQMTTTWRVPIDVWAKSVAVFSYTLITTILNETEGLLDCLERYNANTLFFTPQWIWGGQSETIFTFSINLFNRELLTAC